MLPPLHDRWARDLLGAAAPEEPEATCHECAMRPPAGAAPDPGAVWFTEGKCCTFHPYLHSFLVGGLLADDSPEMQRGRAAVEAVIESRAGLTPLGLAPPPAARALYDLGRSAFGRSRALRCPFYLEDSGGCGIWRHRESTCATWFCKQERGAVGAAFWAVLHELFTEVERALSRHCALTLDVGDEALRALGSEPAEVDGIASDEEHRRRWGPWVGREREYFQGCASIADNMQWSEALALAGARGSVGARLVRAAFARLTSAAAPLVPLGLGRFSVAPAPLGLTRLVTYCTFDPLEMPPQLLASLHRFDGRPTAEVLRDIAAHDGVTVPEDLLRTLVDFEVLVPVKG